MEVPRSTFRRRRLALALLVILAIPASSLGYSLITTSGQSLAATAAEWARDHNLNSVINLAEQWQYQLSPPKVGGTPAAIPSDPITQPPSGRPSSQSAKPSVKPGTPAPATIASQAGPALPDEGRWQTRVLVKGQPAVRVAFVRPDAQHTSYLTGVAWFDQKLLTFGYHPGTVVPGGTGWTSSTTVPASQLDVLAATFNSGFRLADSQGGIWQAGHQVGTLRPGAASFVVKADGTVDVGAWGRDVVMGPDVVAVRQNLDLLVDAGTLSPTVDSTTSTVWGKTVGNKAFVWRSGVGITKSGALVYVAGDALSVRTLGQLLIAAGAVRAMELDINRSWTSCMTYAHPAPGQAVPTKLTADEVPKADRYLTPSTRDFIAALARP